MSDPAIPSIAISVTKISSVVILNCHSQLPETVQPSVLGADDNPSAGNRGGRGQGRAGLELPDLAARGEIQDAEPAVARSHVDTTVSDGGGESTRARVARLHTRLSVSTRRPWTDLSRPPRTTLPSATAADE